MKWSRPVSGFCYCSESWLFLTALRLLLFQQRGGAVCMHACACLCKNGEIREKEGSEIIKKERTTGKVSSCQKTGKQYKNCKKWEMRVEPLVSTSISDMSWISWQLLRHTVTPDFTDLTLPHTPCDASDFPSHQHFQSVHLNVCLFLIKQEEKLWLPSLKVSLLRLKLHPAAYSTCSYVSQVLYKIIWKNKLIHIEINAFPFTYTIHPKIFARLPSSTYTFEWCHVLNPYGLLLCGCIVCSCNIFNSSGEAFPQALEVC